MLEQEPLSFGSNMKQNIFVVSSSVEIIYVNTIEDQEIDIHKMYNISGIRKITIDQEDNVVYIVANSYLDLKGVYVL